MTTRKSRPVTVLLAAGDLDNPLLFEYLEYKNKQQKEAEKLSKFAKG
ncbi:MAG: hypothetical protein WBD36_14865 [Bacteroidota bacterium]